TTATNFVAGAPDRLAFATQPAASSQAGANFSAVVEVRDAKNNPVKSDPDVGVTETITVALTAANGAVLTGGAATAVNWTTGRATFTLTVDSVGSYSLTASDQSMPTDLADAISNLFAITPAALNNFLVEAN